MLLSVRPALRKGPFQDGFTLIEVMVSLALLSLLLAMGGTFMMRALATSTTLIGRQSAIVVANQVLESIRAVDPTFDTSGISPLVYGRSKASVTSLWSATTGVDTSQTYTGSGTTTYDTATYDTGSHTVQIPLQSTLWLGTRALTAKALIGTCAVDDTAGTCTKTGTGTLMFRAIVLVSWSSGPGGCPALGCSYATSTLIDPSPDPQFNSARRPVANADSATTSKNTAVNIPVTFNDSGVFAVSGAVTIQSNPANGTLALSNASNIVTYAPKSGFKGTDTFTYKVQDTSNRISDVAVVTIVVA